MHKIDYTYHGNFVYSCTNTMDNLHNKLKVELGMGEDVNVSRTAKFEGEML